MEDMEYRWKSKQEWKTDRGIIRTLRSHNYPSTRYTGGSMQTLASLSYAARTLPGKRWPVSMDHVLPTVNHNSLRGLYGSFGRHIGRSQAPQASLPLSLYTIDHIALCCSQRLKFSPTTQQLMGSGTTKDTRDSLQDLKSCNASAFYCPI